MLAATYKPLAKRQISLDRNKFTLIQDINSREYQKVINVLDPTANQEK